MGLCVSAVKALMRPAVLLPPFFVGITGRFWCSLGRRSSIRGHRTILIDITA
jgi:hypothetical protein